MKNNTPNNIIINKDPSKKTKNDQNKDKTINQLKSSSQEEQKILEDNELFNKTKINSFLDLVSLCTSKKEIELKYELENNVNLVNFSQGIIEIAFNENLDKEFIKDLSNKLYEWTKKRWIIAFSKKKGEPSKKSWQYKIKLASG